MLPLGYNQIWEEESQNLMVKSYFYLTHFSNVGKLCIERR